MEDWVLIPSVTNHPTHVVSSYSVKTAHHTTRSWEPWADTQYIGVGSSELSAAILSICLTRTWQTSGLHCEHAKINFSNFQSCSTPLVWVQAETHVLDFSGTDLFSNSYLVMSASWPKTVFFNFSIMHHSSDPVSKIFLVWVQAETHVLVFSATDLSFNSYLAISALCLSIRAMLLLSQLNWLMIPQKENN